MSQRRRHDPYKKSRGAKLWRRFAILIAIFFAGTLFSSGQSIASSESALSGRPDSAKTPHPLSLVTPLKPQDLQQPYRPITSRESLRWLITSTIGFPHRVGGVFLSGFGTGLDRPKEYGPHWGGFADRYGMRIACSATGNAMEAGAGLILREDPRYFRLPERSLKTRAGNVVRLTFSARSYQGTVRPAYGRYIAIFGNEILSNTWRVPSEANAQHALVRTAGDFAGRMAANAFEEFWPDVKRHFHKRN